MVLFAPSFVLFSTLYGKDSWAILGLALVCYGYSAWLRRRIAVALATMVFGLVLLGSIRPHIAGIIAVCPFVATLFSRSRNRWLGLLVFGIFVIAGVMVVSKFVVGGAEDFVESGWELTEHVDQVNSVGGSVVDIGQVSDVGGLIASLPAGLLRVFVRPFLWEAHNIQALIASLENLFLLALLFRPFRFGLRGISEARRNPYSLFSFVMCVGLLIFLTRLPNLGLIARQRAMFLPFYFAVVVSVLPGKRKFRPQPMRITRLISLKRVGSIESQEYPVVRYQFANRSPKKDSRILLAKSPVIRRQVPGRVSPHLRTPS